MAHHSASMAGCQLRLHPDSESHPGWMCWEKRFSRSSEQAKTVRVWDRTCHGRHSIAFSRVRPKRQPLATAMTFSRSMTRHTPSDIAPFKTTRLNGGEAE